MKRTIPLLALLFLTGCADRLYDSLDYYMVEKRLSKPTLQSFPHCQGYGCPVVMNVELNKADWAKIEKAFGSKAKDAAQEREKIVKTIGEFERIVGPITGTHVDKRGTFIAMGKGQLDCVDESTNTTIYMVLLREKGLINFHGIEQPHVRWPLISGRGWMHQTAIIKDLETGEKFAVDSWFEDNGADAWIVPLSAWSDGWHPDQVKNKK